MIALARIALRNVLRHRRRSLITLAALFLSLFVMVGIRGFLNGLQKSIRESVVQGQTGALQVHRKGFLKSVNSGSLELDVPADDAFLRKIRRVPGVKAATARIAFGAMATANDQTHAFALFTAIDPVRETAVCPQRLEMIASGRSLAQAGPASAIFTPELAVSLGVTVGRRATLLVNDRDGVMNALDLDMVGVFGQPGLPLPEKKIGFVPLAFAQSLLRMKGRATEIAIAVDDLEAVEQVKTRLQAALGPEFEVVSWHDVAGYIDEAIAAQNALLSFIGGIFLVIALLGIANTMLMSVYERTREIGTMMSVGIRRRQILALFLTEAALLGLGGGLLGAAAGSALVLHLGAKGVALQAEGMTTPMHIHPSVGLGYIVFTLVLATGGAALAALWPSVRASRLRPVEALASV